MTDRVLPILPPLPDDLEPTSERVTSTPGPASEDVAEPPTPPFGESALRPAASEQPRAPRDAGRDRRPPGRRPRRPRRGEERRMWSAGHALIVCVLALAISLLLNAPGVHKKAYNQEAGWQREVAMAFTGPLASISGALLLDLPRQGVQAAIGRSGGDEINTEIVLAPTTGSSKEPQESVGMGDAADGGGSTPGKAATPSTPTKVAFTPKRKLRVWVAGDSLVITPGYAIMRAAGATPVIEGLSVDGRVATGLTRPDVFNWFDHIRNQVAAEKPNVVVLGFGGNDDKAYMTGLPEGVTIDDFGTASWQREYRRRVGGLFDAINRKGAHVIWIGLPQTANVDQTRRFDVINAAVAAEARERPRTVTYIDTYTTFAGPDGGYAEYIDKPSGGSIKVRASDGVHFERAGGEIIARDVLKALNRAYDLTSWKQKRAATD